MRAGRLEAAGARPGGGVRDGPAVALADRSDEVVAALLALPHDDLPEPARSWLREQYGLVVPVVVPDALAAIDRGTAPSPECLARLRRLAAQSRRDGVALPLTLHGGLPALRVFAGLVRRDVRGERAVLLLARGGLVAQQLAGAWLEGWFAPRGEGEAPTAPEVDGDRPAPVEPVDGVMLELVAAGLSNTEIAEATHYSRQAVVWRLGRVMRRWRVPNRAALTAAAFVRGVLVVRSGRVRRGAAPRTPEPTGAGGGDDGGPGAG